MKVFQLTLLAALSGGASAFIVNHHAASATAARVVIGGRSTTPIVAYSAAAEEEEESNATDEEPSDVNTDLLSDFDDAEADDSADDEPIDVNTEDTETTVGEPTDNTLQKLLEISARTGRGEFASSEERDSALDLITVLEASKSVNNVMRQDNNIYGRWELVYSSTELFRSSPFFMAGRAVCTTDEQVKQYNFFCEMHRKSLAISTIGAVRQIVSPSRLISEFEVKVGAVPFLRKFSPFSYSGGLPVVIEGAIVSSADIDTTEEGDAWEISMDTVEIKGSNLPGFRQLLDSGLKLESRQLGSFLESNLPNYSNPKPIFETTYLDERIRIGRDQDDNVFVYSKVSSIMDPTDYSAVMPDLGLTGVLEGFNDSVTKIYL